MLSRQLISQLQLYRLAGGSLIILRCVGLAETAACQNHHAEKRNSSQEKLQSFLLHFLFPPV